MSRSEGCVISSYSQVGCLVMSALDNPLRVTSSVRELVISVKLLYFLERIRMFDFILSTS